MSVITLLSQGRHLLRGSHLEDFDIRLGDSVCVPESLTDNQVDCRPPTNRPNKLHNDTFCHDDALSIDVCIHPIYCEVIVTRNLGLRKINKSFLLLISSDKCHFRKY